MSEGLTLKKFEEASEIVNKVTLNTNLIYSDYFSEQTGNKVYIKPENMQFTGAYKVRGAYYKTSTLTPEERAKGLITASAGNHAQGCFLFLRDKALHPLHRLVGLPPLIQTLLAAQFLHMHLLRTCCRLQLFFPARFHGLFFL